MPDIIAQTSFPIEFFKDNNSVKELRINLLNWFELNGRHWIPWKLNKKGSLPQPGEMLSAYSILVAEVMLQQTQLSVVLPYWHRWMIAFPKLEDLANAQLSEVLILWQGLGYYSRAERIHKASKILVSHIGEHQSHDFSKWPKDINYWIDLPGIGRTTAGSILSSAFDLPTPLLDGNVKRIISRLICRNQPISKKESQLWNLTNLFLDGKSPRSFNQALMDLGATICIPKLPLCDKCPIRKFCCAYNHGNPLAFPLKEMSKEIPQLNIGIGLIFNSVGEVLIAQRLNESSMGGMWEFPGGKQEKGELMQITIIREIKEELGITVEVKKMLLDFNHLYTHKRLHFVVYICELISGVPKPLASSQIQWVRVDDLVKYPFPAANKKMISALKQYLMNKDN